MAAKRVQAKLISSTVNTPLAIFALGTILRFNAFVRLTKENKLSIVGKSSVVVFIFSQVKNTLANTLSGNHTVN